MKRKISILVIVLAVFVAGFALAACNSSADTYYEYRNGNYIEDSYIELNGNSFTLWDGGDKQSGTVKIDGTSIILYLEIDRNSVECGRGTIDDGVIALFNSKGEPYIYYCIKGKVPPVNPNLPASDGLTVGNLIDAIDRLISGEPYKAALEAEYVSDGREQAQSFAGEMSVLGNELVRLTPESDGEAALEYSEYIANLTTGYVYGKTTDGYEYMQYLPQGAYEYLLALYKSQLEGIDADKSVDTVDGLSYDSETRTLSVDADYAEKINDVLDPLYKAYAGQRNLMWMFNKYIELALPGSDIEVEDILDMIIELAVSNDEATLGEALERIELFTGLKLGEYIENGVGEEKYQALVERPLAKIMMGAIEYTENAMSDSLDVQTIIDLMREDEINSEQLFEMIFPNGFERGELIDAMIEYDGTTEELQAKLANYKKLIVTALNVLYVDDVVDALLGGENATPMQTELYLAIREGIKFTTIGAKGTVKFDEDMRIAAIDIKFSFGHDYIPDEDVDENSVFADNNYGLAIDAEVIDYDYTGEQWECDGFASTAKAGERFIAVVAENELDGNYVMHYEWGNITSRTVTVDSVYYCNADGEKQEAQTSAVVYNSDGTFTFTKEGISATTANADYSYTTGINARVTVDCGEQSYTLTLTLIVITDDAGSMLGGLPALMQSVIGNMR